MVINYMLDKMIKITLLFAIFAVVMFIKKYVDKKHYGVLVLALLAPAGLYLLDGFKTYFYYNEITYLLSETVIWLLTSFVYIWSFMTLYKCIMKREDSLIYIFKNDFKRWNIVVLVAIVLGVCSIVWQVWAIVEYGNEYYDMFIQAMENISFLELMSGSIKLDTLYEKLVDLNKLLRFIMLTCMIIPAVINVKIEKQDNEG